MNLEDNTLTYIDCGFGNFMHYASKGQIFNLLQSKNNPLHSKSKNREFNPTSLSFFNGDCFLFHFGKYPIKTPLRDTIKHVLVNHPKAASSELVTQVKRLITPQILHENGSLFFTKVHSEKIASKTNSTLTKFTSDLSQLQAVRNCIRMICCQIPANTEKMTSQLQLVINEIFCNIVKHSYHDNSKKEIILKSEIEQDGIYVTLSDKGETFNPLKVKHPNLSGNEENGFGLFIVQQIVDSLIYLPKTAYDEWNHIRIFKRYFTEGDQMQLLHQIQNDMLIITPQGESLDAKNALAFKTAILQVINHTKLAQLVIDLSHLQFIDSSGLGIFLAIQKNLSMQGGSLRLTCLNKTIQAMFEIVSMHRIFDIFNTKDEALQSY